MINSGHGSMYALLELTYQWQANIPHILRKTRRGDQMNKSRSQGQLTAQERKGIRIGTKGMKVM